MPDREIVIKDIEEYLSSIDSSAPEKRLLLEVKELLKPVAPSVGPSSIDGNEDLLCGVCCVMVGYRNHGQVYRYCHYCPTCGKKVNWNDVGPASQTYKEGSSLWNEGDAGVGGLMPAT